MLPAGTRIANDLRDAIMGGLDDKKAVANAVNLLFKVPQSVLADILALVEHKAAQSTRMASKRFIRQPIASTTVMLDHEFLPLTAIGYAIPGKNRTRQLHRALEAFATTARHLVIDTLFPYLETADGANLREALQTQLPSLTDIEVHAGYLSEERKDSVHIETFLPTNASQLRRFMTNLGDTKTSRALQQWFRWCAKQQYVGPMNGFGWLLADAGDLHLLLVEWQKPGWSMHEHLTELKLHLSKTCPPRPLLDAIRGSKWPALRRLCVHFDKTDVDAKPAGDLLRALKDANGLHARLEELQLRVSYPEEFWKIEHMQLLSECVSVRTLQIHGARFDDARVPKALNKLDAIEHVHLPVHWFGWRTQPWPQLRTLAWDFSHTWPLAKSLHVLPSHPVAAKGTIMGQHNWTDVIARSYLDWHDAELRFDENDVIRLNEKEEQGWDTAMQVWIRRNVRLDSFRLDFSTFGREGPRVRKPMLNIIGAFALARPVSLTSSEPLHPTRPLKSLSIYLSHRALVISDEEVGNLMDSCPNLEKLSIWAQPLNMTANSLLRLARELPRLAYLELRGLDAEGKNQVVMDTLAPLEQIHLTRPLLTIALTFRRDRAFKSFGKHTPRWSSPWLPH
jgi:hypothetical protein